MSKSGALAKVSKSTFQLARWLWFSGKPPGSWALSLIGPRGSSLRGPLDVDLKKMTSSRAAYVASERSACQAGCYGLFLAAVLPALPPSSRIGGGCTRLATTAPLTKCSMEYSIRLLPIFRAVSSSSVCTGRPAGSLVAPPTSTELFASFAILHVHSSRPHHPVCAYQPTVAPP